MNDTKGFVGYEYKTVRAPRQMEAMWRDSMCSFGWTLEKSVPAIVKHAWGPLRVILVPLALLPGLGIGKRLRDQPSETEVEMTFKRDRNIREKAELDQLEKKFESCARGIESLEHAKTFNAKIGAYLIGFLGVVFMALSMFVYLAGALPLAIVLAVPGLIGWVSSYFAYQKLKMKKLEAINPEIEKQHESIYNVCRAASMLLV